MSLTETHRYDDIIDLPHHQSQTHAHMSMHNRAAQFMPFAALTGYDDIIRQTAQSRSSDKPRNPAMMRWNAPTGPSISPRVTFPPEAAAMTNVADCCI